jgi:hypothetical protein
MPRRFQARVAACPTLGQTFEAIIVGEIDQRLHRNAPRSGTEAEPTPNLAVDLGMAE